MWPPPVDRGPRLRTLWFLVSVLWTIATLLRVNGVWVPLFGWHRILQSPLLWCFLIIPPVIFALILTTIHRKASGR